MKILNHPFIQVLIAVLFVAVFAQITIELPGIPITGQTFAVLLVGYILGKNLGAISILAYILLGALGLPIFADGNSGWAVLSSGSGGYLLGFVIAAYFVGWLAKKGWSKSFRRSFVAMFLGTLIILFFGVLWLAYLHDFEKALEWGFYPFLLGGLVKVVLGAAVVPGFYYLKSSSFLNRLI